MQIKLYIITLIFGIIFSGCSQSSTKTESTTKINQAIEYDKFDIPFDSLKSYFEKEDKIVINGWLLLGPKTFFDSVSIDKNLIKGKRIKKSSSVSKFGYWGKSGEIFEIKITDMDVLPYGDFLDIKACEYLDPNEQTFYFLNGTPYTSSSKVLDRIKNYGIKNIKNYVLHSHYIH